jgi:hypothetical protein
MDIINLDDQMPCVKLKPPDGIEFLLFKLLSFSLESG